MNQLDKKNIEVTNNELLTQKLQDATTPGAIVEFDPDEAEQIGAFEEDALTEEDAIEATVDQLEQ